MLNVLAPNLKVSKARSVATHTLMLKVPAPNLKVSKARSVASQSHTHRSSCSSFYSHSLLHSLKVQRSSMAPSQSLPYSPIHALIV
jgi:hypothetical protein